MVIIMVSLYNNEDKRQVVEVGMMDGCMYVITTMGTHPCAYLVLPDSHPCSHLTCREQPLTVREITYSRSVDEFEEINMPDSWIVGWDYAHYGDYMHNRRSRDGHKYTLEEIRLDVLEMVHDLSDYEDYVVSGTYKNYL